MNTNFKILATSLFLALGLSGSFIHGAAQGMGHESIIRHGITERYEWYSTAEIFANHVYTPSEEQWSAIPIRLEDYGNLLLPGPKAIFLKLAKCYREQESGAAESKQ